MLFAAALALGQTSAALAQQSGGGAAGVKSVAPSGAQKTSRASGDGATRPAPPVVTVIHRLSGPHLRALLTPPDGTLAAPFDENFVRTNIVAGYVLADGRTVVARLPHAEFLGALGVPPGFAVSATVSGFPPSRPGGAQAPLGFSVPDSSAGLTLVRADGTQFAARFVGLDASTGLSLLEADAQLSVATALSNAPVSPGRRVSVYAPLPAATEAVTDSTPLHPNQAPPSPDAPVGDTGTVLYMNLAELDGTLLGISRSPTGRAASYSVKMNHVSPEWVGGVALAERGGPLVGIVERSAGGEARLLSAEAVMAAAARIRARRASVPQPWLGARGGALALTAPESLVSHGWPREQAAAMVRRQSGVLLTAVAPETPAARAGLRPGDVITRVGSYEVRGVEDMTWVLKELGGNSPAQFTVWRAGGQPLTLNVRLSEAQNPAFETAQAEALAAQSDLFRSRREIERLEAELTRLRAELRRVEQGGAATPGAAERVRIVESLREHLRNVEGHLRRVSFSVGFTEKSFAEAESLLKAASDETRPAAPADPLLAYGLHVAVFNTVVVVNESSSSTKGLMILSVRPGSVAARAGARAGDLIETVNELPSLEAGWRSKLAADADAPLELGVLREGKRLTLELRRAAP